MLFTTIWFVLGLVLAAILLAFVRRQGPTQEMQSLALALLIAALIYVGFGLVWGDTTWLYIEVGGVLLYGLFIWLAFTKSPIWLAVGWGLHPLWDLVVHLYGPGHDIVPEWYAIACLSFDLLVAGYILYRFRTGHYQTAAITN